MFGEKLETDSFGIKKQIREFSGGPVVGTRCFHCQGSGFDPPGQGTEIPQVMECSQRKLIFFRKKQISIDLKTLGRGE